MNLRKDIIIGDCSHGYQIELIEVTDIANPHCPASHKPIIYH